MRTKRKAIYVFLSILLAASFSINIMNAIQANQRRQRLINYIFFYVEFSITYIERYFENTNDLFNIACAGQQLVELDALIRSNQPELLPSAISFGQIGERLLANTSQDSILNDGYISEEEAEYLQRLLHALNDLLSQLASVDEPNKENGKLTYKQINAKIDGFYSDFFGYAKGP